MQLLIILALLLYGGSNANNVLNEVKPVLESIGGEDMQKALKSGRNFHGAECGQIVRRRKQTAERRSQNLSSVVSVGAGRKYSRQRNYIFPQ